MKKLALLSLSLVITTTLLAGCQSQAENINTTDSSLTAWDTSLKPLKPLTTVIIEDRKLFTFSKIDYNWLNFYKSVTPLAMDVDCDVTSFYFAGLDKTIRVAGQWSQDSEDDWYIETSTGARMLVKFIPRQSLVTKYEAPISRYLSEAIGFIVPEGQLRASTFAQAQDITVIDNSDVVVRVLQLKRFEESAGGVASLIRGENGVILMLAVLGSSLDLDISGFLRFVDDGRN